MNQGDPFQPGAQIGEVSTVDAGEPLLIDERARGSTVSELEGGLGPEELAITPEERARESERLHPNAAEPLQDIDEKPSTGYATGRKGMLRVDGRTVERPEDWDPPSTFGGKPGIS